MWHRLKVHTEDLAHARFSCAKSRSSHKIKSNSFYSIALQVYFCINTYSLFLALKKISGKNIRIIKKIIVNMCVTFGNTATRQGLSLIVFLKWLDYSKRSKINLSSEGANLE